MSEPNSSGGSAEVEAIRARWAKVLPCWGAYDEEHYWVLFASTGQPNTHPMQIIKARKEDSQYAPYWPDEDYSAAIENAPTDIYILLAEVERLRGERDAALAQVAELAAALEWYANLGNYFEYSETDNDDRAFIERDQGARARAVLTDDQPAAEEWQTREGIAAWRRGLSECPLCRMTYLTATPNSGRVAALERLVSVAEPYIQAQSYPSLIGHSSVSRECTDWLSALAALRESGKE